MIHTVTKDLDTYHISRGPNPYKPLLNTKHTATPGLVHIAPSGGTLITSKTEIITPKMFIGDLVFLVFQY